jgi:multidrug transporter EmrE-like cation transporter
MGIVLLTALVAWLIFKEKLSATNWLGIALSLGAIALIAYG